MNVVDIFYDGWEDFAQIALAVPVVYFTVIAFIRFAGKRSTSQMNNFDWVVTVALGSIAGSAVILDSVTVLEALFAIGLLLLLQWILTFVIARSDAVAETIKANPRLLVYKGEFLDDNIRDERLTHPEVMAALRENGLTHVRQAESVILETDASFSVIASADKTVARSDFSDKVSGLPPKS